MSYDSDQNDLTLPSGNQKDTSASNLIPKYFRTDTNKKIIGATIDQLIKPGVVEKINAYAGRRYAKATIKNDIYLSDVSADRENYQFDPYLLYKDDLNNVEFLKDYNDYISTLKNFNGSTVNHSKLNSQEFYSWDPHIDFDKFVNFREYYWLPNGPEPVAITGQAKSVVSTYTVRTDYNGDNVAFIFTPNGLDRNPRLKLYREQVYRFEIDTEGHPFAFTITRTFVDQNTYLPLELDNLSTLYTKGVKKYVYNQQGLLVETQDDYIEKGVIEFTVPSDAPVELFYISKNNIDTSGILTIFDITENSEIDLEKELIGKKTYKIANGPYLTNGMKVYFQGTVTPEIYSKGYWYVEGVGEKIVLISEQDLEVPSVFTADVDIGWDEYGFDTYPFEIATGFPTVKDYIVVNRASADRNPWSRYNRWFHKDTIEVCLCANKLPTSLDESARAKRPIIEFEAGLKLYNHGAKAKKNIDLVDDYTQDVFSIIEGSRGYNIDGIDLVDNMRVLFTADTDILVKNKIYTVKFIIHNGIRQISLLESDDTLPNIDECVLVKNGMSYKGKMFFYNGTTWKLSQEKTAVNQPPLFDLFDKNGNSLSDTVNYPATNFVGNKIFSYRQGSGSADVELGFNLSYKNINNVGDIVFDFNLLQDEIVYQFDTLQTKTVSTDIAFVKQFSNNGIDFNYVNGWKKAIQLSLQAVVRIYDTTVQTNRFPVDVFDNSGLLNDLYVKVYVNGVFQKVNQNYTIVKELSKAYIVFENDCDINDTVYAKFYSNSDKNQNGFYEIPQNFENNPLNENILSFTLGEINDHVKTIVEDHPEFVGNYPGLGNLRDISNVQAYGKKFIKHSGLINLAAFLLINKEANLIKSIQFCKKEYAKFKRNFIRVSNATGFDGSTKEHVDLILEKIANENFSDRSFYFSDMVGKGAANKTIHTVEYNGPAYFALSKNFSLQALSNNAVGVYRNGVQLLHERDYVFQENFVYVKIDLADGDTVEIYEYESTAGSAIPPTPTKLGLYPKFYPEIFIDTSYTEPVKMIQGHDGSIIKAFDDYRDDLILEYEMRVFNNIKTSYNDNLLDIHEYIGGEFRQTNINKSAIDTAILNDFINWLDLAGNINYTINSKYDTENTFSYNYSYLNDKNNKNLKGYWRNVYKNLFDTDRPHTHPWEMLGFFIKPEWWDSVYGPAPYTSDNLILWTDLSEGIIREPNKELIRNKKYLRPTLLEYIPVDEFGNLISPYQSGLAQNLNPQTASTKFEFGDQAPVETAWRRSSEYPFSLIKAFALLQPAKFIGIGFDISRIKRDNADNLVYIDTEKCLQLSQLVFPSITTNEELFLTSGLVNFVSSYMASKITANYEKFKTTLKNLSNQLGIKIAGFSDKTKLKLILDSKNPLNKSSVFVPDENYNIIFNTTSTLDIVVFSGILIEKIENGFVINGYDKDRPYFEYNNFLEKQFDPVVNVGGISEPFVDWGENQQYISGNVVRYNNIFYRTKISHMSNNSFDASKFSKLSKLPVQGGVTAILRSQFTNTVSYLQYGTVLDTVQQVVDFMLGYENALIEKGFVFDFYNTETESLEDMKLAIREFLFWITQNWDIGTALSLSPSANRTTFQKEYYVVDDVFDDFYEYSLLTGDGVKYNKNSTNIFRDNLNKFNIKPTNTNDGIYLVKLPVVQKEHVVLIDNTTVFNDTIYQLATGYRQDRIKLVGYRTDQWNGSFNIPGFIFDNAKVRNWQSHADYAIGDLVKYKEFYYSASIKHTSGEFFDANNWSILQDKPTAELLPNWEYKTLQFTDFYDLDTDNFDIEQQRLGQHLIGYQPREYLANIITDTTSQYKFYQGFIQDKGTKNSLNKLFDALSSSDIESLEFYEEWAIRLAQYGMIDNILELEYQLDETNYRLEPQIFELVNSINPNRTDLVYEIPPYNIYLKYDSYDHSPFTVLNDISLYSKDRGYVRDTDVDFVINDLDDLIDLDIFNVETGNFIWVTSEKQSWNVYRIVQLNESIYSFALNLPEEFQIDEDGNSVSGFTAYFTGYVDLSVNEIVGIKSDGIINGFYKIISVKKVISNQDPSLALTEVGFITDQEIVSEEDFPSSSTINLFTITERKFANIEQVNNSIEFLADDFNDKIWVDNNGENVWAVYKNNNIFSLQEETINPTEEGDGFGVSFAANGSNTIIVIGSPYQNDNGKVRIYNRNIDSFTKNLLQELEPGNNTSVLSNYGYSVNITSDSRFIVVGAPNASYVKTKFQGDLLPGVNYFEGDIVRDRGILWRAKNNINFWQDSLGDSSTISINDQDWEPVYVIETDSSGTPSTHQNQGVVYIYERNSSSGTYQFLTSITSPNPSDGERFGYKVVIKKTVDNSYRLFVGAPGKEDVFEKGKIYFLEFTEDQWSYAIDRNYKGVYSDSIKYNVSEIVFYNGTLYKAKTAILPGSNLPGVSALWEIVEDELIEYTGYVPRIDSLTGENENTVAANSFAVGKKFVVNNYADVLAISATGYYDLPDQTQSEIVLIYARQNTRWINTQTISTNDNYEDFGLILDINEAGNKVAIGAPRNDQNGIDSGCVYIYASNTNNVFELSQTLRSPFKETNESFGTGISFSKNKLAISGKNTDIRSITSFDRYSNYLPIAVGVDQNNDIIYSQYTLDPASVEKTNITTFDGGNTKFITITKDAGRIALFQDIGQKYLYAEDVAYQRNTIYNDTSNFILNDNHIYIGLPDINPSINNSLLYANEDSSIGMFVDLIATKNADSWQLVTKQDAKINLNKIQKVFLYDKNTNDILTYIDFIDPRQGKIAGAAEQEITYKTYYDPAIYSTNDPDENGDTNQSIIVDENLNWTEEYVGKIWWNLSTASWYNPYQGNSQYRVFTWNKLIPAASIDVLEWVGSVYTPSEWNALADTNEGIAQGISGTAIYSDNIYSSKRVYDSISQSFRNKYFYWVKNKKTIPTNSFRKLSADSIANLIADPAGQGYRFIALLSNNSFAIYNNRSFINGQNTILHFTLLQDENINANIHTEYQLLTEGLATSKLNPEIEQKWFDSLIGYDLAFRKVPDDSLSAKQKYGILNNPRQGMFVNKFEALKQFVERINEVLAKIQIVDNYNLNKLLSYDPFPAQQKGFYDQAIDTADELRFVSLARFTRAELLPVIENGKIIAVNIVNSGRGYRIAPSISIDDNSGFGAVLKTTINNLGQITSVSVRSKGKNYSSNTVVRARSFAVLVKNDVEIGGRWAIYNYNSVERTWSRVSTQSFDTRQYWRYINWFAEGYNELTPIDQIVEQSYQLFALENNIGDIVKINNIGSGGYLLLQKIDDQLIEDYTVNYKTIGRENGTIELLPALYNYSNLGNGFDSQKYDNSFYDREPIIELKNICTSLRDDILIGDNAAEYNKAFFASLRYAMSEQLNLDWAFKTSFIRAKHNLGNLTQKITYQNDNLENYEDYISEVKPYSSKVREYISSYKDVQPTNTLTTDFDLPPSYDQETKEIEVSSVKLVNNELSEIPEKYNLYPAKSWLDNNGFDIIEVVVVDGGSGYTASPRVTVGTGSTELKAYVSRGSVNKIEIISRNRVDANNNLILNEKYLVAPNIIIDPPQDANGSPARATAILGNSLVRSMHTIMKFDRTTGNYLYASLNESQNFVGTGAVEYFELTWPMNIKTDSYSILVNGIKQLSSEFTVGNVLDTTKNYDRYKGFVKFSNAPALNSTINIEYKKDIKLLNAADRINFFYSPKTGMPGKDLAQLMEGVEYSGSIYDSYGFGNEQGFDSSGYGSLPWDSFDNTYEDEIFVLDGSTTRFELSRPLEDGVEYNFYLNNVRLDDPEYDATTVLSNPNALMNTIIGDGVTTTVIINEENITTKEGDVVVIRKSTSDGSFAPVDKSYDTALSGGNLNYSTATGIASADINIDGDGFVTTTTSKGPEELVPGQILDTLDIQVYHRITDGCGIISSYSVIVDGITNSFSLPGLAQGNDSIIVKVDNSLISSDVYEINWPNNTITIADSTLLAGQVLTIITVGNNGINLVDSDVAIYDGSTVSFVTAAKYNENISALIFVNGIIKNENIHYTLEKTTNDEEYPNRIKIVFSPNVLVQDDYINYTIYSTKLITYSQILIDKTFTSDGENNYHIFDNLDNPIPFDSKPYANNILVKTNDTILNPGYSIQFTTTSNREYQLESWQFVDTTLIKSSDVFVFVDRTQIFDNSYTFNPIDFKITLSNSIAPAGSDLRIYLITNAEYYFIDTKIITDGTVNLTNILAVDDNLVLESTADSTLYNLKVVSVSLNTVVVRSYHPGIQDTFALDPEFMINSVIVKVEKIEYISSNNLTFAIAPSSGESVEIYQFSNHDINDFYRINYDVLTTTSVTMGSADYTNRNLISSGIVVLRKPVIETQYAWVMKNGNFLTPNIDYIVNYRYNAVELKDMLLENDRIDILQFGTAPVNNKFGFRIFKDMLNRTHYKRINQNNSYELARPLNYYDSHIILKNSYGIYQPDPAKNIPGVIFIAGERIEYYVVIGNALTQLRRGTLGTGVKTVYSQDTVVFGQGPDETINYRDKLEKVSVISDGSTAITLQFVPSSGNNEIDVFVGGRRLRKDSLSVYSPTVAQDSPEADVIFAPEFTIDDNLIIFNIQDNKHPNNVPLSGEKIEIVRKLGKIWNEIISTTETKSLVNTDSDISNFLRKATIHLPK